jgi:hypothetical protein
MSKMIFKNKKNIIDIYFSMKNYLKSNHYHTANALLINNVNNCDVSSPALDVPVAVQT